MRRAVFLLLAACSSSPSTGSPHHEEEVTEDGGEAPSIDEADAGGSGDAGSVAPDATTSDSAGGRLDAAVPSDAQTDTATQETSAPLTAHCGLLPNWTPVYTVTCPSTMSDPSVDHIEWRVNGALNYTICGGPCHVGDGCRVYWKAGGYTAGACAY